MNKKSAKTFRKCVAIVSLLSLVYSCGGGGGGGGGGGDSDVVKEEPSFILDPAGGSFTLIDGTELIFPPGAVAKTTKIYVHYSTVPELHFTDADGNPIEDKPFDYVSMAYHIEPDDAFLLPYQVKMKADERLLHEEDIPFPAYWDGNNLVFIEGEFDPATHTVTITTQHNSVMLLLAGPLLKMAIIIYGMIAIDYTVGEIIKQYTNSPKADLTYSGSTSNRGSSIPNNTKPPPPTCIDKDGDGFGSGNGCLGPDCNDNDKRVHPGAREICGNGKDDDCSGGDKPCPVCPDADGDGYRSNACGGTDCNDSDRNIHPGMREICGDGIDNDCKNGDAACPPEPECGDSDGDGYKDNTCGGNDCAPGNNKIYPGAPEICGNRIDEDCNGSDLVCPTPPAAPSNLTAVPVSASRINLQWQDNSANEDGFKIEWSAAPGGPFTLVYTTGANATSQADTGLSSETPYYYRAYAFNGAGVSSYSNEIGATTLTPQCNDGIDNDLDTFTDFPDDPDCENLDDDNESAVPVGMALIPTGCFNMGDAFSEGETRELPVHNVCISSFNMDVTEVTNAEYKACVDAGSCTAPGSSNSYTRTPYYGNAAYDNYPVIYVDWNQATAYCSWAGKRLPTEAEWEYAARGGLSGKRYPNGDAISCAEAVYERYSSSYACWNYGGLDNDTHQVGSYAANGYGLYDMAGNVWEWTNDWYLSTYYSVSPTNDPPGPNTGTYRVLRGGCWGNDTTYLRVSHRNSPDPTYQGYALGFRCSGD